MKKQLLFSTIAMLFSVVASAADLYVRDFGAGGAYSSISAAITAAVDGDRIIIQPKAGGIPYLENLTINKSLTFVSETNFTKYIVQGNIVITAFAGRTVTIHNLNFISASNTVSINGNISNGRTTLNIFNSTFSGNVVANIQNVTLNISGCDVLGICSMSHGKATGNNINQLECTSPGPEAALSSDDIEIIANKLSTLLIGQVNYKVRVLNNFILGKVNNTSLYITGIKSGSINEITNNVILSSGSNSMAINIEVPTNPGVVSIINNILISNNFEIRNPNPSPSVYAFYNMSNTSFDNVGLFSAASNVSNASITINSSTFTVTGANVNAGYPIEEYQDLDLSLNDIGNFGGSNSWSNYWPTAVGNKPQVNYLNTPRRVYTGTTTLNVTGSGYSK